MSVYRFTALDKKGEEVEGSIPAGSPESASGMLKMKGLYPTRIEEIPDKVVNPRSHWSRANWLQKRVEGFIMYQIAAVVTLFSPEKADNGMAKMMEGQWKEKK